MYRYIFDNKKAFEKKREPQTVSLNFERFPVKNKKELMKALQISIDKACFDGHAALALSGGIDSAILARLVPKGTKAYTFRCVVPTVKVIDESPIASKWAELNSLEHEIIDIYWEDIVTAADICMVHKGAPIHSIEAQIYIAAKKAMNDGMSKFIFGENADIIYGGMDGLLAQDWTYGEFIDRYSYIMPYKVLREPCMPLEPYKTFEKEGKIDGHDFINTYFRQEALGTYINACKTAGIEFVGPYSLTRLAVPLDYKRIRLGDTKYIIRELFKELYPNFTLPAKIPMPRPMNEWFLNWTGPSRPEFIPHCTDNMNGDQKWMVWCLERYLNILGGQENE